MAYFPHGSSLVPIGEVQEVRSAAGNEEDRDMRQKVREYLALSVVLTRDNPKNITAARKVFLNAMRNTSKLLFSKAADLIELVPYEKGDKIMPQNG